MVYRDEQSGELGGLTRVLSITQDDSHVFCRHAQVKEEFFRLWDIVDVFYISFGFKVRTRLSFHDPKEPEKYLGTKEIWQNAETALREIAKERNADYVEAPGEAALYGPKLDFMATDSIGREHQVATIQLDMNLPERFDLTCVNERGEKGAHRHDTQRHHGFYRTLLRRPSGTSRGPSPHVALPVQVKILPVSERHEEYARTVLEKILGAGIRAKMDVDESLGKRIRTAKIEKVPYFVVIGDQELEAGKLTVETRTGKMKDTPDVEKLISLLQVEIMTRK